MVFRLLGLWSYIGEVRSTAEGDSGWILFPESIRSIDSIAALKSALSALKIGTQLTPQRTTLMVLEIHRFTDPVCSFRTQNHALGLIHVACVHCSSSFSVQSVLESRTIHHHS